MAIEFVLLAVISAIIGLATVVLNIFSSSRFLKGEVKDFMMKITAGITLVYIGVLAQAVIEIYGIQGSPLEYPKYTFMILGFGFFFWSAISAYRLSKALGFGSQELPEKLKRILSS